MGIEIGKCIETFSIRIPEALKSGIDKMSAPQKAKLKNDLLIVMARNLHESLFDPAKYLSDKDDASL